jgi:hypothetical protein
MLLVSQSNLDYAGLLPLTVNRWAKKAKDTTPEQVQAWLDELDDALYVVMDDDTAELLIRTFIRNDEVWKQPNVMVSAARCAVAAGSRRIRRHLATEAARMLLFPDLKPGSARALAGMVEDLPEPFPTPDENPSGDPSPNPSDNPSGNPRGWGKVTEVGTDYPPPLPATTPTPVPALRAEPPDDPTGNLLIEHANAYPKQPPPSALIPVRREISRLVAEGVEPDRIRAGLSRLREKQLAASLLPQLVTECGPKPSTTDQRVAAGLALVARYEAEEV